MPPKIRPPEDRFFPKVDGGDYTTCWLWTGARGGNYGRFGLPGGRVVLAHRWSWEFFNGPIPDGLTIDHLCRTHLCVNPWHLEPVTQAVNNLRAIPHRNYKTRTHCVRGHDFNDSDPLMFTKDGRRVCRICMQMHWRKFAAKKRQQLREQSA